MAKPVIRCAVNRGELILLTPNVGRPREDIRRTGGPVVAWGADEGRAAVRQSGGAAEVVIRGAVARGELIPLTPNVGGPREDIRRTGGRVVAWRADDGLVGAL